MYKHCFMLADGPPEHIIELVTAYSNVLTQSAKFENPTRCMRLNAV